MPVQYFAHVQDDLNQRIVCIFEAYFRLTRQLQHMKTGNAQVRFYISCCFIRVFFIYLYSSMQSFLFICAFLSQK